MYRKIMTIGEGAYGKVYCAKNNKGEKFAIKRVWLSKNTKINGTMGLKEIDISLKLRNHKYLNGLHSVESSPFSINSKLSPNVKYKDDSLFLIFPFADGCLVKLDMNTIHIKTKIRMMYQLLSGLYNIHHYNIIHRDIKLDNILYNINDDGEYDLLISDFGFCEYDNNIDIKSTHICVNNYKPPEIIMNNKNYNSKVDIWSLGCSFGEMLKRSYLFEGISEHEIYSEILTKLGSPTQEEMDEVQGKISVYINKNIKGKSYDDIFRLTKKDKDFLGEDNLKELYSLLKGMLEYSPSKRWSAEKCLSSKLFNILNFNEEKIEKFLPINKRGYHLLEKIDDSERREIGIPIIKQLFNYEDYHNYKIAFTALDIYDRCLLALEVFKDGKSDRDKSRIDKAYTSKMIAYTVSYISIKLFKGDESQSFKKYFPDSNKISTNLIVTLEKFILKELLQYNIYRINIYDLLCRKPKSEIYTTTLFNLLYQHDKIYGISIDKLSDKFSKYIDKNI